MGTNVDVSLVFASDGSTLDAFESFSWRDNYTDPKGSIDLMVTPPRDRVPFYQAHLQKGAAVTIKFDGLTQATAIVQSLTTTISPGGGTVYKARCVSVLGVLYEATVNPDYSFRSQTDVPVSKVVLDVAGPFGFDSIQYDAASNRDAMTGRTIGGQSPALLPDTLKFADAHAHPNERAYALIARVITRLGLCLRSTWDGKLLLCAPDYSQQARYTLAEDEDGSTRGDRFFGDITIEDSNDDQYSHAQVYGSRTDQNGDALSARPIALVTSYSLQSSHPPYQSSAQPWKPLVLVDKNARDRVRCTSVAKLALGLRAAGAWSLTGTTDGFRSSSGSIYHVDTIATVTVKSAGITGEDLWVAERQFVQDRNGGQRTTLKFLPKGALVLGDLPGSTG
jgi:prophage tail gpP-like protein